MYNAHTRFITLFSQVSFVLLASLACEKQASDTPTTAQPLEETKNISPPDEEVTPTVETFATQLTKASCDWIQRCKNEELVREVQESMSMVMTISAPMMRPDLKSDVKAVSEILQKVRSDNRLRVTPEECDTIMTTASKVVHLDSASLAASVREKRVRFDEEEAKRCLEAFRQDSKLCSTETKTDLAKPYIAGEAKYTAQFQALTQPCKAALSGLVEVGGQCVESYECKGEHTKCNFMKRTCR